MGFAAGSKDDGAPVGVSPSTEMLASVMLSSRVARIDRRLSRVAACRQAGVVQTHQHHQMCNNIACVCCARYGCWRAAVAPATAHLTAFNLYQDLHAPHPACPRAQ